MNIFVTGASGFIGNSFIKDLLARVGTDDIIYTLVRVPSQCTDKRVKQLPGTLEAIDSYRKEVISSAYFFHIAADPKLNSQNVNASLETTQKIVSLLLEGKSLRKFVYISSIAAVGRESNDLCSSPVSTQSRPCPNSKYGRSKLDSEKCIFMSGLPYVILRPSFVYGKFMRDDSHINKFVSLVWGKNPLIHFNYPGTISLINVDDLARAMTNCIYGDSPVNKTYFAETESTTIGFILNMINERLFGKKLSQIPLPFLRFLANRFHVFLPLNFSILFSDYFWAKDDDFRKELLAGSPCRKIVHSIDDVISTNKVVLASRP